ncbi:Sigma-E factor regulatory protein RseB precursor|nr:Sigma-E factor regulatory protein RseB precursor [Candidatus Pantoea persica]
MPLACWQEACSGHQPQQMEQASQTLNYEFAYINVSRMGIESLRYRHALIGGRVYVQLQQMDGPRREVIQRGTDISYFEPGLDPFSLPGNHIIDGLLSLIFADFDRLASAWDFIPVGRSHIADQLCEVSRIVSRNGTRYSYMVWLDVDTRLTAAHRFAGSRRRNAGAVPRDQLCGGQRGAQPDAGLQKANLPPAISVPEGEKVQLSWQPGWVPSGMMLVSQSRRDIPAMNKTVESRLYSDGLFSFAINISPANKSSVTQTLRTRTPHGTDRSAQ